MVKQRILDGLVKAIQAEIEGRNFYQMAANSTTDAKGKEVFEYLADEEQRHADYLRAQHRALSETGHVDKGASFGEQRDLSGGIFSDDFKSRIQTAHFEMTALSIGAQLEKDAVAFYKAQADAADDPEVAEFFMDLARWEQGHYKLLLAQQDALKGDYWAANQFAPF